jgi:hypothetical protein
LPARCVEQRIAGQRADGLRIAHQHLAIEGVRFLALLHIGIIALRSIGIVPIGAVKAFRQGFIRLAFGSRQILGLVFAEK